MYTKITVNGRSGSLWLTDLGSQFHGPVPPALACLVREELESLEVEREVAEEVASFIDQIIATGRAPRLRRPEPPLLFSPSVGDDVEIVRDVLVELQGFSRRGPRIWRFVSGGTRGRVVARHRESGRVLLHDGPNARAIAYVRDRSMTRTRSRGAARQ